MSYEDSFDREAADEKAYDSFERWYIFENLQPPGIGKWEWLLMFEKVQQYPTYQEALRDSREMARELGRCVDVKRLRERFVVLPDDYYLFPNGSYWMTYPTRRARLIEALVIAGKYPDLVRIASEMDHPGQHAISRHYFNEVCRRHDEWKQKAGSV